MTLILTNSRIQSAHNHLFDTKTLHLRGDLAKRLDELEQKTEGVALAHVTFSHNTRAQLKQVFAALRELMTPPKISKQLIGFITPQDKTKKPTTLKRKP